MPQKRYILSSLAKQHGYTDNLCQLLHAKEVECLHSFCSPTGSYPFVEIRQEGIEDNCSETDLVKMALGEMDYFLRVDCPWDGKDPRLLDRELAIESGENTFAEYLTNTGNFDFSAYSAHNDNN